MTSSIVGVISDTHGLLRPEAVDALRGCSRIVHAGDVGKPVVLDTLRRIAPTVAVRGNVDDGDFAQALPSTVMFSVDGVGLYVLHDLLAMDSQPAPSGTRVVISGHSHQPRIVEKEGVLYLNPGSSGPRRFRLPITLAHLEISSGKVVQARVIDLFASPYTSVRS